MPVHHSCPELWGPRLRVAIIAYLQPRHFWKFKVCETRPRPPADHSAQARVVTAAWAPGPGSSSLPRLGRLFLASRGVWGGAGASLSPGFNGAVLPSTPAVGCGALFPAAPIALGQDLSQALVCKGGLSPPHWTDGMFQCNPTWLCVEIC